MLHRVPYLRWITRTFRYARTRTREEWASNGFYGLRRMVARRLGVAWLRRLVDPFAPADALAKAGFLDKAIALCRSGLADPHASPSALVRRYKLAWLLLADLLTVNGQIGEAGSVYETILAAVPNDREAWAGIENLRRRENLTAPPRLLKIHFFTIVLNGMPLIEDHIGELLKLDCDWHWHIVEGIASLTHDTGWSRATGGRVTSSLHHRGLSNDGTTEYLDRLAALHPEHVTIYRKESGQPWDGKIEMVRAPLAHIAEECLLWQIDADEFWGAEQILRMRQRFSEDPERTAAFFLCHYFVRNLVVTTANTFGNHLTYEWLRVWRFQPGDQWQTHEPPRLSRRPCQGDTWTDIATVNPFAHGETLADDLVFRHLAYVLPAQIEFKETYYGYKNALKEWQGLPQHGPVRLRDHLSWIKDGAVADTCSHYGIVPPIAPSGSLRTAHADGPTTLFRMPESNIRLTDFDNILIVKLDNIGDAVLLSPFLRELRHNAPNARITLAVQSKVFNLVELCPYIDRVVPVEIRRDRGSPHFHDSAFMTAYKTGEFDLAIVPRWDIDESGAGVMARASDARRVVGFSEGISQKKSMENRGADAFFSDVLLKITIDHEVLQNLALLRYMNGVVESNRLEAWISRKDRERARVLLDRLPDSTPIIAVCPGASHIGKILPSAPLVHILKTLPRSVHFIILGGGEDRHREQPIVEVFGNRCLPLCGKTSLREAQAIIARCSVALSMDSALAHFAAAVHTPVVVFSMHPRVGGNDTLDQSPTRFGPWCEDEKRLVIQPERAWPGCETGCRWRGIRPHCIGNIDLDVAAGKIASFVSRHLATATLASE